MRLQHGRASEGSRALWQQGRGAPRAGRGIFCRAEGCPARKQHGGSPAPSGTAGGSTQHLRQPRCPAVGWTSPCISPAAHQARRKRHKRSGTSPCSGSPSYQVPNRLAQLPDLLLQVQVPLRQSLHHLFSTQSSIHLRAHTTSHSDLELNTLQQAPLKSFCTTEGSLWQAVGRG